MKLVSIMGVAAVALLAFAGTAQSQALGDQDREFMKHAAAGGAAEVELGRVAAERATQPAVQQFGTRMVKDHSASNAGLMALARAKAAELPVTLEPEHQAMRDRLVGLRGAEFDRAYMTAMVDDHQKDVAAFERAAQSAADPELRAFAARTLPVLREHLALAQQISSQVASGVMVAPAALAAAAVRPWCGGAYAPTGGTNFATCPPVAVR